MRAWWLAAVLALFATTAASAAELKIATWNLDWLSSHQTDLPADVKPRVPEDFDRLRDYAVKLAADVVAIEEVDGFDAARRVFAPGAWSIHLSHDRVRQRVGVAVRRGITYDVNPDVTAIALDPRERLRSGADVTLRPPAGPLRVLVVHLKQGCESASPGRSPRGACALLVSQFDAVARWIAARRVEAIPFVVLGDFNRELDRDNPFRRELLAAAPLTRATEGFTSPCWGREAFIDHILLGGPARGWLVPNSLRVLTYQETDPTWKTRLSDHCPVSVRLAVPD